MSGLIDREDLSPSPITSLSGALNCKEMYSKLVFKGNGFIKVTIISKINGGNTKIIFAGKEIPLHGHRKSFEKN